MSISAGKSILQALLPQKLCPVPAASIECSDHLIEWLIESGLGPIAYAAASNQRLKITDVGESALMAADLTARVISSSRERSVDQILKSFAVKEIKTVLLKGIAVAPCYPHYHWRIMSDVDLLVATDRVDESIRVLRDLGYVNAYPEPDAHWDGHHHVAPLRHPDSNLCVELHHSLDSSAWFDFKELSAKYIWNDLEPVNTFSVPTNRLESCLELNHLAAHWYLHLIENPGTYGLQRAVLDAVYMLRGKTIDKNTFISVRELSFATLTLLFVLRQLNAIDLPEKIIAEVLSEQHIDRRTLESNAKLIMSMICSTSKSPTTLRLMIQSSWIELALVNDNPKLFYWRRFKKVVRLLSAAAKLHGMQLLRQPTSSWKH